MSDEKITTKDRDEYLTHVAQLSGALFALSAMLEGHAGLGNIAEHVFALSEGVELLQAKGLRAFDAELTSQETIASSVKALMEMAGRITELEGKA